MKQSKELYLQTRDMNSFEERALINKFKPVHFKERKRNGNISVAKLEL